MSSFWNVDSSGFNLLRSLETIISLLSRPWPSEFIKRNDILHELRRRGTASTPIYGLIWHIVRKFRVYLSRDVSNVEGSDGADGLSLKFEMSSGLSTLADINRELVSLTIKVQEYHECYTAQSCGHTFYFLSSEAEDDTTGPECLAIIAARSSDKVSHGKHALQKAKGTTQLPDLFEPMGLSPFAILGVGHEFAETRPQRTGSPWEMNGSIKTLK